MPIANELPKTVSKLMRSTTPCAPSNRLNSAKAKVTGGRYNKNSGWICLKPDEAEQVDQLINQLFKYVSHCKRRDDGCKLSLGELSHNHIVCVLR